MPYCIVRKSMNRISRAVIYAQITGILAQDFTISSYFFATVGHQFMSRQSVMSCLLN